MSDADQLNALERQQRQAYWKGEETAQRRLPAFLPQDPIQGAVLAESERIEEQVWNMEQEAQEAQLQAEEYAAEDAWREETQQQGMLNDQNPPTVGQPQAIPEGVDVQGAREMLAEVNRWGGELDDNSVDQFVIQIAKDMKYNRGETLADRPRYEQKAEFYKWLRKMENWSEGKKEREGEWKTQESPDEKFDRQSIERRTGAPKFANELPEGQETA